MDYRLSALRNALTDYLGSEAPEPSLGDSSLAHAGRPSPAETFLQMGLTPEEYLCELIRGHGGRIWQQDLIEETGWAASSMSQYLTALEDAGRLSRRQIGREKAVGFPGAFEATAAASEPNQHLDA